MRLIERAWYQNHPLKWLLLPLSLLFALITGLRRRLYHIGLKKQVKHKVPVIVVGNIGVGGNGKTPVVVHLCQLLSQQGVKVGVISRGYGGQSDHYPLLVETDTPPSQAGDEPVLIKQRTNADVVVSPNRNQAVQMLIDRGCQVVISDDGLQHYKLGRQVELVVVDARRQFGNGWLMPAGPLREGLWRLNSVDQIILNVSGVDKNQAIKTDFNQPFLSMDLQPDAFINIKTGEKLTAEQFCRYYVDNSSATLDAVAGIGDPARFFSTLDALGITASNTVAFSDHYQFSPQDFEQIATNGNSCIVMTEKDAVKCRPFANDNWWYLAVSARFNEQQNAQLRQLVTQILSKPN